MPRVVDHAARRLEIVHALWAVIHARGLDSVSFRAVAEAGGVSIGRIQHYFPSKAALIREGCAQMVAAAEGKYREQAATAPPGSRLWALLSGAIPGTDAERLGAAVWYAYLAKSVSDPALAEIVLDAVRTSRSEAIQLLRAVRDELAATPDAALEEDALALLALGDGLTQRVLVGALDSAEAREVLARELTRQGVEGGSA